jgi:hypothetical protein
VFSLPSKCGFLSQFGATFFLNIRCQRSEAEEATRDKDVSKYSTCASFFYTSRSSSNFLSYYYSAISCREEIIRRGSVFIPYIKAGILWKSNNHLRWGVGEEKVLYKRETQRDVL